MKCLLFLLFAVLTANQSYGGEHTGDSLFALRYEDKNAAAEAAKAYLENAEGNNETCLKAVAALDFDIMYCREADTQEKKQMYKELVGQIGEMFSSDTNNAYFHLSMAMIYGRCGQICDLAYSVKKNIPGKIFYHASKAYETDKGLYDWTLPLMLGKLHLETPKIPFVYSWPDAVKAEAFLNENVVMSRHKLRGMLYLAELKKKQGKISESASLLDKIIKTPPAEDYLYEDNEVINSAKEMLDRQRKGI